MFDRIIGQGDAVEVLESALRSGRLHHAWIFAGPAGVGKHTTALELAKRIVDPAGDPAIASRIDRDEHPDVHRIHKERALESANRDLRNRKLMNIPLDLLRELMLGGTTSDGRDHDAPAYRTPWEATTKVFIVDEAELLDAAGQNALLKTLEEPPAGTYIILVTSRPERLLPTIRSRAQVVRFRRLDEAEMETWRERCAPDIDAGAWPWIRDFAAGAPGIARLAADHGFDAWARDLREPLAMLERGGWPTALGEELAGLVDGFATEWVKRHKQASKDAANKAGARHVLRLLGELVRRRLPDDPDGPWPDVADRLADAEAQIESNVNMKHVFENLVAQWGGALRGVVASAE